MAGSGIQARISFVWFATLRALLGGDCSPIGGSAHVYIQRH
jgi:hypothetical protein